MAPKYRLSYFPIKALAEPIRLLLSYGNIDFEDRRIPSEEWPKHKESMPMGQMPVLEIDGKVLHQSLAICRYLAKQVGIAGNNDLEALEIDIMVDTINDFRQKVGAVHYEANEEVKKTKMAVIQAEVIPFYLKKLDGFVAANNGYFALGKLTLADFFFVGISDYLNFICQQDITANHPNLKALKEKFLAIPAIVEWYKKAPKTDY